MADDAPTADARPDLAGALRAATLAAIIAAVLFLPLIAFHAVHNIRNELLLETRWPLFAALVGIVFLARFTWDVGLRTRFREFSEAAMHKPAPLALAGAACGAVAIAAHVVSRLASDFGAMIALLIFYVALVGAIACAIGAVAVWLRARYPDTTGHGRQRRQQIGTALRAAALGFLIVYPLAMVFLAGPAGSLKWIDNFGIQILIYVMLGWGLNIVMGFAGLLDLGYVAFYAIGAYSYALLAKNFGLSFWILLPLAGCLAAFWGILLGFPVLRLRGDYLAIVTLAFGEIIRLVLINWKDLTNGYAGILSIPRPSFFGLPFNATEQGFAARFGLEFMPIHRTIFLYYLILALALLTAFITLRLRRLPVGRAWEALREDEIACRSLGINTTNTKLTAFAIGAMFGGFAGSFFAARQGFISPESFTFMESATIVAIVVLGGMGSQIGVAVAAILMIGGTELMRELDVLKALFGAQFNPAEYRMLLFGLAMVLIMIWKPRGLISTRQPSVVLRERKGISGALVREGHG